MQKNKSLARLFAAPFGLWAAVFIVLPLFFVLYSGLSDGAGHLTLANLSEIAEWEYAKSLLLSIGLALISTVICLLLAYPLVLILRRVRRGRGALIFVLFLLPLWMNSLLTTMAWQTILETHGVLNTILTALGFSPLALINTPTAIVIGMVYNFLPYMVLPLYVSVTRIDPSVIDAARDLGASFWQALRRVMLPLSMPGIVSGCTMVGIPALTPFVISALLGGNKIMLIGNIIEQEFTAAYDWQIGSALSMVLMVFILLNLLLEAFSDSAAAGKGAGK